MLIAPHDLVTRSGASSCASSWRSRFRLSPAAHRERCSHSIEAPLAITLLECEKRRGWSDHGRRGGHIRVWHGNGPSGRGRLANDIASATAAYAVQLIFGQHARVVGSRLQGFLI